MKKRILLLVALFALMFGGCDEDVSPQAIQQLADQIQQQTDKIDDYQETTSQVIGTLREVGIIDEQTVAKIEKVGREIDRVQPQVAEIVKAIQETQLSGSDIADWIAMAQAANQASAPYNPYALPITAGLTLASLVFGFYERSQSKKNAAEAEKNGLKYQAHKQGVVKTMITQPVEVQAEMYANVGEARVDLGV